MKNKIPIRFKKRFCKITCTDEIPIIYNPKFCMSKSKSIRIGILYRYSLSLKSRVYQIIHFWKIVDISLEKNFHIYSSFIGIDYCIHDILISPHIYLYPYAFFRIIDGVQNILLDSSIWQYPHRRVRAI